MKKSLILAAALMFSLTTACYADNMPAPADASNVKKPSVEQRQKPKSEEFKKRQAEFDKRLKLTDEQKAKAEQIRQKGREQMKPIMEKMKEKRQEAEAVKRSRIAVEMQQEKLAQIHKEMQALKREAHRLRMENMKEFEAILTPKQQKELKKMKAEGRKKFEKEHKKRAHRPDGMRKDFPQHRPQPLPLEEKAE